MGIYRKMSTLFLAALIGLVFSAAWVQASEVKIALDCPPDLQKCGTYVWSHAFADHLKANGFTIKQFASEALGGEDEKLDQVSQGLLEVSNSMLMKVGQLNPAINGFWLFFLWDSIAHLDRVLDKSDLLDWINQGTGKKGVRVLALIPVGGFTGIANAKKSILVPGDLKGLRMRATDKVQAEYLAAWGANTVVIPWPEIYNALQTGVADGYLNPAIVPTLFKHTEVIKHYADVRAGAPLRVAIASEKWYAGLSDKQRALVKEAVAKANQANRRWLAKVSSKSLVALEKAGVKVSKPSPEQRVKFAQLAKPVYAKVLSPEAVKRFQEAADKNR